MKKIIIFAVVLFIIVASPLAFADTCSDGIQNGDEEGIDCGGNCPNECYNEVKVDVYTTGDLFYTTFDISPTDEIIVLWGDQSTSSSLSRRIDARRFDLDLNPLSDEYQVSPDIPCGGHQKIGFADDGSYVISHQCHSSYPNYIDIYNSDHTVRYDNKVVGNWYGLTGLSVDADGSFWLAGMLSIGDCKAKRFDTEGNPISDEIYLHSVISYDQRWPEIENQRERFIGAWGTLESGNVLDVATRIFLDDGTPVTNDYISPSNYGVNANPTLAVSKNGDYAVLWTAYDDASDTKIMVQFFNSDGSVKTEPIVVNQYLNGAGATCHEYDRVRGTMDDFGNLLVVYSAPDGSGDGIFGRYFDKNGNPLSDEFLINNIIDRSQQYPWVEYHDGYAYVTWATTTDCNQPFEGIPGEITITKFEWPEFPCEDLDGDGYSDVSCGGTDFNDGDPACHPNALEICDGKDNNGDGNIDENITRPCGEGACAGQSTCTAGEWSACSTYNTDAGICALCDADGNATYDNTQTSDCISYSLPEIATCSNDSDNNPFTWDYAAAFSSQCMGIGVCGTGNYIYEHKCSIYQCNAECESDANCIATECDNFDGCYDGTYRDYQDRPNYCESCLCTDANCTEYSTIITDTDGDGYDIECDNDCDDTYDLTYPGAPELCDNRDNNCNGNIDETICGQETDADCDGINDCTSDKCLNTIIPESVPTNRLNPNSHAVLGTSEHGGLNVWKTNTGSAASPVITDSEYTLVDTFGCSCEQILYCKPGSNNGEYRWGCSAGTMNVWTNQKSWATYCQIDGKVVLEGEEKTLLENTDEDILIDIIDSDNDNDGINDDDDQLINDADNVGSLGYGTPDWWEKKYLVN